MAFVVVLDACVLVPHPLFDTLLRAADAGMYEPRWTVQILDEVERTLVNKMGVEPDKAKGRILAMQRAFPHAQVDGHEDLIDTMRNDPKDRHVLAAAVRASAGAVVTANLKDFPPAALEPYATEALHPDDFLLDLLDLDRPGVLRVLDEQARAYVDPPVPLIELRRHLSVTVPRFAAEAERLIDHGPLPLPLPLVAVPHSEFLDLIGHYDRRTPLSAAAWWWRLLAAPGSSDAELADAVSDPSAWKAGFATASSALSGLAMSSVVHVDDPGTTAWVKFGDVVPATTSRTLAWIRTHVERWVVVVATPDGLWRVAGLAERPGGPLQR